MWAVFVAVFFLLLTNYTPERVVQEQVSYSEFVDKVESDQVASVMIVGDRTIMGQYKSGASFTTYIPFIADPQLARRLTDRNVIVSGKPAEGPSLLLQMLISWLPFFILIGLWVWIMRQAQGGGGMGKGGPLSFGRSRAKMTSGGNNKVTFKDVAGIDECLDQVKEFVDFLKNPKKFQQLGGTIPKGALLMGSPGTGKTLLAKAVAGEADVPFFSISGSDFVEMFVGVGAARVRDMFEQAKKHAPSIIFIDEIDAVGRHRGAGVGGGNDEREQTLNQLLVEMDGFEGNEGVIVLAASNRIDVLDPALLRPGRFDRRVEVPLPDIRGREKILKVHMKKLTLAKDVDAMILARGTPGFSGADLANLANEAALFAAKGNKRKVSMSHFNSAKDKILMGAERSMAMSEDEKKLTAYHEAGHAVVGRLVPEHDPVYKVSIIPRGRALGVTMFLPEKDHYSVSIRKLESQLSGLYGGRVAEELIFGKDAVTTGASNDIEKATELARNIVSIWGLSDKMGPINYSTEEGEVFLGKSVAKHRDMSDSTAQSIDKEIHTIVDRNYQRALKILKDNIKILHLMADCLIKYETIEQDQIDLIMEGKEPNPPEGWNDDEKKEPTEVSGD
ncbi:ATP-dependent zinc metalloprotease FtsH [Candidatus Comchoanobacter bicostacola]|uniref:ATP-dependent zinc metalloprotease FtsH n=2 Tax=Candidatus Comchoanobacter bicostacola TaxID=2919598 RepID=A0ABY5DMF9_9GAMM|nr:ATP-dependent zinc metalloprotease FtsH [Candidatus Comchoanobacter bicostacola]